MIFIVTVVVDAPDRTAAFIRVRDLVQGDLTVQMAGVSDPRHPRASPVRASRPVTTEEEDAR